MLKYLEITTLTGHKQKARHYFPPLCYYEMIKPLPTVLGVEHVLSAEIPQIIRKSGHKQGIGNDLSPVL